MGRPIIDLTGKVFGRLTVVHITQERHGTSPVWACLCVCGSLCYAAGHHLKYGSVKSCGCLSKSKKTRTSHMLRSKSAYTLEQQMKIRHTQYRLGAEKRGYSFNLPQDLFLKLIQQPCHYCGTIPETFAGIDRVDNAVGYKEDNVVSCCSFCNQAKLDRTAEEFVAWARQIVAHHDGSL